MIIRRSNLVPATSAIQIKIKNRLVYSLMVFLYNVTTHKTPLTLYTKLSFSIDAHHYPTRHAVGGSFILPRVKTSNV